MAVFIGQCHYESLARSKSKTITLFLVQFQLLKREGVRMSTHKNWNSLAPNTLSRQQSTPIQSQLGKYHLKMSTFQKCTRLETKSAIVNLVSETFSKNKTMNSVSKRQNLCFRPLQVAEQLWNTSRIKIVQGKQTMRIRKTKKICFHYQFKHILKSWFLKHSHTGLNFLVVRAWLKTSE